ncbi:MULTISPECIES: phage holin family protein [unclassified Pseudonocardia]|jgi:uncharacterized membrane protein YqjE|uniref:phage holin family protein n=1 Tax=unclassified Pseudonocardia TaxID=2619320 RepID=UPI001AD5FA6F|nr:MULTISPECIES: phage holin family protein [unclassified Pseudonocardia]MBN9099940.1 phage holin family protein [Pseudonocardia sp.]
MTSSTHDADLRPATDPAAGPPSDASTGELLTRLSSQVTALVKGELELARAELTTKGKRAGVGAGLAGAGGVVALYGVGALVAAAVAALALVLPVWLSAVIVAVVLFVIAGVLALVGRSSLRKAVPPVPEAAVENVQEDVSVVKEAVRR